VYILRARRDQLVKLQGTSGTISTNQFDNLPLLSSPIDLPSRFLFMVHFLFFLFFGEREREKLLAAEEKRKELGGPVRQTYTPCKGFHACMFCSLLQQPPSH
jgi:hypothetical protein